MENEVDREKWNAACDVLWQMVMSPGHEHRAAIRDEKCCWEVNEVRGEVLKYISNLRK